MKANELMIGDWVRLVDNGKPCFRVAELHSDKLYVEEEGCQFLQDWYYDDIEPIPITAEILKANGFKVREGCTTAWDWHSGETSVHISGDHTCPIGQTLTIYVPGGTAGSAFSSHRAISDLKIRGIHELQHALLLCGIEKEIIL